MHDADVLGYVMFLLFGLFWLSNLSQMREMQEQRCRLTAAEQRVRWLEKQFQPVRAAPESDEDVPF